MGKTRIATDLALAFETSVLSADSRQIYREMKIGTAVPAPAQLKKAAHYFIASHSVKDYYNASMFEMESLALLEKLFTERKVVVMAGGSGLYIDAVCGGIDDLPSVNPLLRKELAAEYRSKGIGWLRDKLHKLDPEHYKVVDTGNPKRMLKAVEISIMAGKPYSAFLTGKKKERDFKIIRTGLNRERTELYDRINARVDEMMENGLKEEARELYPYRHLNALNTVGYKELFEHFDGRISLDRAVEMIKQNSRHYAKRQLTWLGRDKDIKWFHPERYDLILEYIEKETGITAKKT